MEIKIITEAIARDDLRAIARNQFGSFVKAVVDIKKEVMAIGGELHADEEAILLQQGSLQDDLWGTNIRPDETDGKFVEFNSMINIRPSRGNSSRGVENEEIQQKILYVVKKLIRD